MSVTTKMVSLYEAADILNVHANTLKKWISQGKVNAVKMGRAWKLSEDEVERIKKEGVKL